MSGSIYDPQRLLIVKRKKKKEGKRGTRRGKSLNHLQAEDTIIFKGHYRP